MRTFFVGLIVGLSLSGVVAWAGNLYDSQGNVSAPHGSQQQMDYFRARGQQLDIQHLRQQADRDRLNQVVRPCEK